MHMDSRLYQVIASGDINGFTQFESVLHLQVTIMKNTILHIAVQFKKKEFVEEIYRRCPSLLCRANKKGDTPLHIAARLGLYDIVEFLIDCAKIINDDAHEDVESGRDEPPELLSRMKNMQNDTALHEAVRNNDLEVVKLLTNADPSYSYFANNAYKTPLYIAAEEGFKEIVDQISTTCQFSTYGGPHGMTALHAAVMHENSDIIKMLLEKKEGIIKEADDMGRTPLHYAAYNWNSTVVEQLLEWDSSVAYVSDKDGMTPLHFAAMTGARSVIKVMSERCPDCWELPDNKGRNFLHVGILDERFWVGTDVVRYVLGTEHKMVIEGVINEADNDGNTPLHLAVIKNTPWHLAAINEWKEIALLLCRDPRVNKRAMNNNNFTALDIVWKKWLDADYSSPTNRHLKEFYDDLRNAGAMKSSQQQNIREVNEAESEREKKREERKRVQEMKDQEMKKEWAKVSQTHLVVATLIATVTFAAGFTLPGGYISEKGHDQGMATLSRKAAFRAFMISDVIAMVLSTFAVFIHFFMVLFPNIEVDKDVTDYSSRMGFFCTLGAIVAMVVAFVTGIYLVLANSPGLAISTCVIGCSFYLLCGLHLLQLRLKRRYGYGLFGMLYDKFESFILYAI